MNIFYLDASPEKCAQMHNDKHCVKMILEYAQLMSTAHRVLDGLKVGKQYVLMEPFESTLYKATHINHPSAIWTRESVGNYDYLFNLFLCLCQEYTYRYGKTHKTESLKYALSFYPKNIPQFQFSPPPMAMPEEYKISNDVIESYKNYYILGKAHLAEWKNRPVPDWYRRNNADV